MLRADSIGFGGYVLYQDSEAFCYGVDAVLLADFSEAAAGSRILDLCCGNGAVSFICDALYGPESVTGVELLSAPVSLARRSAYLNGVSDRLSFVRCDAADVRRVISPGFFDVVLCNPPYFERGRGVPSGGVALNAARHETTAGLAAFISAAAYALKKGGSLCLVHRPSRLPEIISESVSSGLEPKRMRLVAPKPGKTPNILLLECVKGAGKELKVLPELVVRNNDGKYTEEIDRIYRR